MRKIFASFALVATLLGVVFADAEMDEGVLVLTDDNFDGELAKYEHLLVEFYAPWCGHCKKLTPEYIKAAAQLAEQDPPRFLAKVDATENKQLAERFGIQGFPTLKFFNQGKETEYNGGRTADTIFSWIMKKTGPSSTEVTCDQLKEKATGKLNLAYFGDLEGYDFEAFISASKHHSITDDFAFFHTADKECAAAFGSSAPGLALIRTFDDSPLNYASNDGEAMAVSDILAFASGNSVPTLITFSEDYIEPIFGKRNAALMLFTDDHEADYSKVFAEAAKTHKGKILFVNSGATEGIQQKLAEFVGVSKDMLPTLRLIEPSEAGIRKFRYDEKLSELTVDVVGAWVDDFRSGKLSPFLKSEEIPETQEGPVHVVVGKSFDQVVMDSSKDVLVKYYAPWCGHCKKLAPIWEELAQHYANVDDLVIAKFDSTANEVDGVDIRSYPTLIFYPKDNKAGVPYSEGRELDDFKAWLNENSSAVKAHGEQHTEL